MQATKLMRPAEERQRWGKNLYGFVLWCNLL